LGTAETLVKQRQLMKDRTGVDLVLKSGADLNLERDFGFEMPAEVTLTKDAQDIIKDPNIHIVVELVGGMGFAKNVIEGALKAGKSVVTANKALLAEHGPELIDLAIANNCDLYYEAAVAGGIPIIKALREGLVANPITSGLGIMNGTCNYILTRMEREGVAFDEVLADAQRMGYAEAEPSLDVDGWDTAHKTVILANLAFGGDYKLAQMHVKGIRGIAGEDVNYALELGYRIKLLSVMKKTADGQVEIAVEPTLIPSDHLLSKVDMSFNAVFLKGEVVDETLYYGRGAGRLPTASAVVGDIAEVGRNRAANFHDSNPFRSTQESPAMKPYSEHQTRAYLRMETVKTHIGTIAEVTTILARHKIVVSGLKQEAAGEAEHLVILTGDLRIADLDLALKEISELSCVKGDIVRFRVEALGE